MDLRHIAVDDINTLFREEVVEAINLFFVARNGFGGKKDRIALTQLHSRMGSTGDAGERGAPFTLTAGDKVEQRLRRQVACAVVGDDRREVFQRASLHRRLDHPAHGASGNDDRASAGLRRLG